MGFVKMLSNCEVIKKVEARRRPSSMSIVNHEIYLGGLNGLEKFDMDLNREPEKITEYRTASVLELDQRFIAAGTVGHGLFIYDSQYSKLLPLPIADATSVYSMVSDWRARRLWVGTEKRIVST